MNLRQLEGGLAVVLEDVLNSLLESSKVVLGLLLLRVVTVGSLRQNGLSEGA